MHVAIFSQAMEYVSLGPCVEWAPPWCAKGKRLERDSRHGLKRLVKRLKVKAHPYIRWHMRPFHGSLDYSYCSMMVFEEFCVLAIEELETNRSAAARPVARPFAAEARASHEAAPMSLDPLLPLVIWGFASPPASASTGLSASEAGRCDGGASPAPGEARHADRRLKAHLQFCALAVRLVNTQQFMDSDTLWGLLALSIKRRHHHMIVYRQACRSEAA